MYLDVRILALILIVGALMTGLVILSLGRRFSAHINGIRRISYGMASFVLGMGLLGLENRIPDYFAVVLGTLLALSAIIIMYQGIRRFQGEAYRYWVGYFILIIAAVLLTTFTYVYPSPMLALIAGSLSAATLLSYCAAALVMTRPRPILASHLTTAVGFIILAIFNIFSAGYTLIFDRELVTYFSNSPGQGITVVGFIVGMVMVLFGFVMMVYDEHNKQLGILATHDELTGLYNRRMVLEILKVASKNSRRNKTPLSVLMIDLDNFKQVNDDHGHMEGDVVLKMVADALASAMRESDSLGRFGGEEFIVVLPNTNLDGARILAERVRSAVDKKMFISAGEPLTLTASVGVGYTAVEDREGEDLIQRADTALMGAKLNGRNLVVVAD